MGNADVEVFIVEDESAKRKHIAEFVREAFPRVALGEAKSVSSALAFLEIFTPSLVILDMSLPTFDVKDRESGWRPQGAGGQEVLRFMQMSEMQVPVVLVTGYEAFHGDGVGDPVNIPSLNDKLVSEFGDIFLGTVYYNSTYDGWNSDLFRYMQLVLGVE